MKLETLNALDAYVHQVTRTINSVAAIGMGATTDLTNLRTAAERLRDALNNEPVSDTLKNGRN